MRLTSGVWMCESRSSVLGKLLQSHPLKEETGQ
jgi:hypothetical protein